MLKIVTVLFDLLFGPTWRSYKLTFVRSSVRSFVRPFVTSFSRDWLISFFWFLAQRCKMAMPKMWRSPIFEKKFFWANLGQKLPKNRVFWTLCKIASLVFSDFWQKDRGQCVLKNGWNNFFRKIFFRRELRIFVFWGNSLWPFSFFLLFSGLVH